MTHQAKSVVPTPERVVVALVSLLAVTQLVSCTSDLVDESGQNQSSALGSFNVLTRNYNNQRTGANLSETILNTSNVNSSQFGRIFQVSVDDQVYSGILYASGVSIAGGTHNVFYVATVNNTVYAFDADTGGSPLWQRNFNNGGRPTRNNEVGGNCGGGYVDFSGNIGIVSTPVIDGGTNTIYVVTRTIEGGSTIQRLRALDIGSGADRANSPHVIPASGAFNPVTNNQRPALALSQGIVYVSWSSFCDTGPFHGLIAGYDATSLGQVGAFNTTPSGTMAGIWMGAAAPVIDPAGSVYVSTGNGTFDGNANFGESVVKMTPSSLMRQSFFTPSNWSSLNDVDNDLGSSGPIILPGLSMMVTGSKQGKVYLMNTSNLGGSTPGDTQLPQVFQAVDTTVVNSTHHIHNTPVAWQSPSGLNLYVWGENDFLRAYRFNTSTQTFNTPAFAVGSALPPQGMPGGMLAVSANGSAAGSGIVWATMPKSGDANHAVVPGILRAFNAENLALLWDSNAGADDTLNFSKFNPPVVANGKVYVASFSNAVSVYGPRMAPPPPASTPFSGTPINLPGTIEAENFDNGGEGVAYHDADTGNTGGAYRSTDVDLQVASEGNFNVGWINALEWLKYTVNVTTAGTYNLTCRVASQPGGGSFRVEVDGVDATGAIAVGSTGAWDSWATVSKNGVNLPGGKHVLRVFFLAAGMNLNSLTFAAPGGGGGGGGGGGSTPFTGTPVSLPGTIEAENFDNGGEGVAYHDADVGNTGGAYRTTDVDIQTASEGAFNVGWISVNEWLNYSVNVTAGRAYTLNARIASQPGGGAFRVEVDGTDVTGSIAVNATGSWTTWATVTKTGVNLPAGAHVLRVFFTGAGMNLNSMTFQ